MRAGGVWTFLGLAMLVLCTACGSSSPAADKRGTPGPGQTSAASATSTSNSDRVELETIFPAGDGRNLVLDNCQNCHTFVPIVVLQKDPESWQQWTTEHREKVASLSDDQFQTVLAYLTANFGPHRPVPTLPKELLDSWTTY